MVADNVISGKEFRQTLHRPLPNAQNKNQPPRVVPAFTIQSMQRGTVVLPPPKSGALKKRPLKHSAFRTYYKRGDLPVILEGTAQERLIWKVDIQKLDYHHYLPMFFEGLTEIEKPYKFIASQGIIDMLAQGGNKVFPCIPQLIIPLKNALNTKNKAVMISALKVMQHLVRSHELVGEALVPYYRQLLPILNLYKEINVNLGDGIDYSQMNGDNLADIIAETLEVLERFGGEDAFINIKYMIPTYESCMMN